MTLNMNIQFLPLSETHTSVTVVSNVTRKWMLSLELFAIGVPSVPKCKYL